MQMQPQKLCLKWNSHTNNLLSQLGEFQRREVLADVTISCEGHNVKAHKMVLSVCSPYFEAIFQENPCQHPIVIINGMSYENMSAILDFMYKGEVNVVHDGLQSFLHAAETLQVKGLAEVYENEKKSTNSSSMDVQPPSEQSYSQRSETPRTNTPPRKRQRNRKRSLSDSNRSEDEGTSRKHHREPSSPEVHELSGDESYTGDTNSNGPPFNNTPRVPQNMYSRAHHSSSNLEDEDEEYEVDPSKLLEQNLTTDSVSMNNSSSDKQLRIEKIMGNATEIESSSLQEPESPPDIKPIIDYGDSNAGPSEGSLMLYNDQSQPGPSNMQDGSLIHDNSHAQDGGPVMMCNTEHHNRQILTWIKKEIAQNRPPFMCSVDIPVRLPVDTFEDFTYLDEYLRNSDNFHQMSEYMSARGGKTIANSVNDNLRHLMTNRLATFYNYKGTRGKSSFEATNINDLIINSVKKSNGATDWDIITAIKVWLKHAPQRFAQSKKGFDPKSRNNIVVKSNNAH